MAIKGISKSCKKGHQFYKSSECPTCPVCEPERKPKVLKLHGMGPSSDKQ